MDLSKNIFLLLIGFFLFHIGFTQEKDTLKLDLSSAEKLLLENNLGLLAQELNINKAEAEKIQAKIWPNPTLSVENFNPYATRYQRKHAEEQASLFGNEDFGKYRQIEVQLEQTFNLAGKRQKRKAIAEVSIEMADVYLADFLSDLITEFRKKVYELVFLQKNIKLLAHQLQALDKIYQAYNSQYEQGNVSKGKLIRLRSSKLDLKNRLIEEKNTRSQLQSTLIVLLNLPEDQELQFRDIFEDDFDYSLAPEYSLSHLQGIALKERPSIRLTHLQKEKATKKLAYEKSLSVPDLTAAVSYDRGGGIYPDFVGIGFTIDLPFSNSNKGAIKKAQFHLRQEEYHQKENLIRVKSTVREKYEQLLHVGQFLAQIDTEYMDDLEQSMAFYNENFRNQNIGIVEFMDFMETYIENRQTILENQRNYLNALEELKYATGLELSEGFKKN